MKRYITIDGGTTNTRVFLIENGEVCDCVKISIGTRAAIDDKNALVFGIRDSIDSLLKKHSLCESDVIAIIASGTITSEIGLCPLAHISAPAGVRELNEAMYRTAIPEISAVPFYFIRGVICAGDNCADTDMMRGEETEIAGVFNESYGDAIYVLPGSHSKVIKTDFSGRITDFSTHMTGEMIYSLSQHTILKAAVDLSVSEVNVDFLLLGYSTADRLGINKALFKTRVLKNIFGAKDEEVYSFFIGVVLCDEVNEIISKDSKTVVVGGRSQMKRAISELVKRKSNKNVIELCDREVDYSVALGAVRIFENR